MSERKPVPTFAALKQPPIVKRPKSDVTQDKSEWLISEDYSILQVIKDQQGMPLNLKNLMPGRTPNWDLTADAVNALSPVYRSARNCRSRFENALMMREKVNNGRRQTRHLYQQDSNAAYTSIFLKRCKTVFELAQKRKAQAKSVKIQKQQQKVQGKSGVQTKGATTITNQQLKQLQIQQNILNQARKGSKVTTNLTGLAKGKSGVQTKGATTITNQQLKQLQIQQNILNQARKGSKVTTNLTRLAKVPDKGFIKTTASISAPVNSAGNSQQVKGLPTAMIVQQIQQAMKAMPQNLPVGKSGVQTKGATTITNQQLKQLQIQQNILNQARKGSKVTTILTRLAKVPDKGFIKTTASISAAVNSAGNSQQVKGLPTAMIVQQIQQAMKAMPQNLPVVVAATPSLPGIQHTATTLRRELGVVASAQTTTLPSTTLTTSNVLKGTSAAKEQQQTAAILQQAAASSAGIRGQHAVTLAVQATASQAQGQQVQIQVQPSAYYFLVTPQAQVVTPQTSIQQLPQNVSTINIAPPVAMQNVPQASSILSPSGTIVQQMPADSTIQSF